MLACEVLLADVQQGDASFNKRAVRLNRGLRERPETAAPFGPVELTRELRGELYRFHRNGI
jgi:hypothetical protein